MDWQTLLKRHEGFRARPYCDRCGVEIDRYGFGWRCNCQFKQQAPGEITIGHGTNLSAEGISEMEAAIMLFDRAGELAEQLETFDWFLALDPVRYAAILDLAYATGFEGFCEFTHLIAAMEASHYGVAATEVTNSLAAQKAPARFKQLAEMLYSGQWPKGG